MKTRFSAPVLIIFGFLCVLPVLAQTQLYKQFRFEDGGYTLVGINSRESDKNALADSLGDFYTDDIAVLNAIKAAWIFRRSSPMYACGYHYGIIILKDGKEVASNWINLNCHELTTNNGSLYFDERKLSMFRDRFKKLFVKTDDFGSRAEALSYWSHIHSDKRFVFADEPDWLEFDGSFGFLFKCPEANGKCNERKDKYLDQVKAEIAAAYPDEKVKVQTSRSIRGDLLFNVRSTLALYRRFKLYKVDPSSYFEGQWEPIPLSLRSYWKSVSGSISQNRRR